MNKVIQMGRLTRDPEVRYTQGAEPMAIARFTLAVDRAYKKDGEAQADFFPVVAFRQNGEFAEQFLKKGMKIVVEGRLETGSYTDKDGVVRYTTDIIAERQYFAESKKAFEAHASAQPEAAPEKPKNRYAGK